MEIYKIIRKFEMIGFSNFDSLISLCGAGGRFGARCFASQQYGGSVPYTAEDLSKAAKALKFSGNKSAQIKMLIADSRRVVPGSAFFAVSGLNTDGNKYVDEAVHRGAVAVVSQLPCPDKYFPAAWIQVEDIHEAMCACANSFYGNPSAAMNAFAVTGTNGKTSVSWMLQKILNDTGHKCGLIGTIHYDLGGRCLPASRTTPETLELHAMLSQMRYADCKCVAMEISSHSIAQKRVKGLQINCAAFTNLTQDHLDYHKTMESYFQTKASLFTGGLGVIPKVAVINFDDPYGKKIAQMLSPETRLISYGTSEDADVCAQNLELAPQVSEFDVFWNGKKTRVSLKMPGRYNVLNALTALSMALSYGIELEDAAKALSNFRGVPGRMQKVNSPKNFDIFVDYAHTDDALKNGLSMLRNIVKGRLLVVFGCGGKRDRTKRPKMTAAVQRYADIAWATSDNPRGENLEEIFDDMKKGVSDPSRIAFIEDRRRAINLAIDAAGDGDCILIAGKGHETFQELGDTIIPFDDKRVAEELLALKGLI